MATETVLVKVELEGEDALTKQEQFRLSIKRLTDEKKALELANRKGQLTEKEYTQGITRNETAMKVARAEYNKSTQAITGHVNVIDKLTKELQTNTQQLSKTQEGFKSLTGQINIGGTSVDGIISKFANLAGPAGIVTAAIGVFGFLEKAYASSTRGAKDLEFAHNQLSAAINLTSNAFANLITSGEDGEGLFTTMLNNVAKLLPAFLGPLALIATGPLQDILDKSKEIALAGEQLEDLGREEIAIRTIVDERFEDIAEKTAEINAEQTTFNEKLALTGDIINLLRKNETELVGVKSQQLAVLENQLSLDKDNESVQTAVLEKQKEISKIERDTEKRVQNILKLKDNINQAEGKRIEIIQEGEEKIADAARARREKEGFDRDSKEAHEERLQRLKEGADAEITQTIEKNNALLAEEDRFASARLSIQKKVDDGAIEGAKTRKQVEEERAATTIEKGIEISNTLSAIAKKDSAEQKAFALSAIVINTGVGIANAVRAGSGIPWPGNLFAILSGVAAVLAGIASAKNALGFAYGGLVEAGNTIAGYANGGLSGTRINSRHGRPIRRSNGDNLLATVKVGEVILNERQQAALGGDNTFRKIGVPGFAGGGDTSLVGNAVTSQSGQSAQASMTLGNTVRQIMESFPPIVVYADDVSAKQNVNSRQRTRARVL